MRARRRPRTITHLLDHRARVWRATTTQGDLREEISTYAPVIEPGAAANLATNKPRARLADMGPGLAPVGERVFYMDADDDVRERDVVQLVDGPDTAAGSHLTWEVDGPPHRPRGHHLELVCRAWHGELPAVS